MFLLGGLCAFSVTNKERGHTRKPKGLQRVDPRGTRLAQFARQADVVELLRIT